MKPKLSILDPNPTPLQYLSGLSQELFREIYIKRDDLTPFGGGGNKLRKLEYLMIEALNSQATTIVTVGAPQTNHGRLTAAVAAKFGLKCIYRRCRRYRWRTERQFTPRRHFWRPRRPQA